MNIQTTPRRKAFTLVELLVVIAILTLLAAIITPAVYFATVKAKNARTGLELAAIEKALEAYKLEMGEYPPDFSELANFPAHSGAFDINDNAPSKAERAAQIIRDHLQRVYRRRDPAADLPRDSNGNISTDFLANLSPANSLVLWLSGFTNDPVYPLFKDSARTPFYEFDKGRFGQSLGTAYAVNPTNQPSLVGTQIGLVAGYLPKSKMTPIVYYKAQPSIGPQADALCYSHAVAWAMDTSSAFPPLPAVSSEVTVPDPNDTGAGIFAFVAPTKFQLLSAGEDDTYGEIATSPQLPIFDSNGMPLYDRVRANNGTTSGGAGLLPSFPGGENYSAGMADNVANFSGGNTLEDSKPE